MSHIFLDLLRAAVPLFKAIVDVSATNDECIMRITKDWGHVMDGLKAIERSSGREPALRSAASVWAGMGELLVPVLEDASKRNPPEPGSDPEERFACNWHRCVLHEPDEALAGPEMMRCTRCREVCAPLRTDRIRLTTGVDP